jgi:hypothetical protein
MGCLVSSTEDVVEGSISGGMEQCTCGIFLFTVLNWLVVLDNALWFGRFRVAQSKEAS